MAKKCPICGADKAETRKVDYLYSHRGRYLLVPNTPVEVCLSCGTAFYEAKVLKEIERRFFAIESQEEQPEGYLKIPMVAY